MGLEINQIATFGDARRMILDTIVALKNGEMDVNRGMAIAASMKVLNDSIQVEINAAKMVLLAEERGHNFGKMVGMGQKLIANDASQPPA
jgi:hypothetical protein